MSRLNDIFKSHIALSIDDIKTARSIVKNIICTDFINHMKLVDTVFNGLYHTVYYTGSFYQGLKIIKPNEFDLNLVLNIDPRYFALISHKENGNIPRGFAKYALLNDNENLERKFICDGYLSPKKLRDWFKGVFTKAFDKLNIDNEHDNYILVKEFKYTESGPAMTIRIILKDSRDEICVDLVPVVPVVKNDCVYLVPKLHPRDDLLWRLSYPNVEIKILKGKSGPKSVIKFLKLLYHNSSLQKLCSYYIKMLVMLEVDGNCGWPDTENENKDYLLTILNKLQQAMLSGVLPSVHDREFNLFHLSDLTEIIRINNYGQLKKIIRDFLNEKYEKHLIGKVKSRLQSQSSYEAAETDPYLRVRESIRVSQQSMYYEDFKDLEDILEEELPPPPPHTLISYDCRPMGASSVDHLLLNTCKHENINKRQTSDTLHEVLPSPCSNSFAYNVFVSLANLVVGVLLSLATLVVVSLATLVVGVLLAMGAYYLYNS